MQITCFQCRQRLDVPDDSAGKRVHCPHCAHVIVVPAAPRAEAGPATALPSLELDAEVGSGVTAEAPKVPTTPVPPMPLPAVVLPAPTLRPRREREDDPPTVERVPRRRARPLSAPPAPPSGGMGKAVLVVGIVVALIVGVFVGAIAMNERQRPKKEFAVKQVPPVQPALVPQLRVPKDFFPPNPPLDANPPAPALVWHDFQDDERRFQIRFPGPAKTDKMFFGQTEMTSFEAGQDDWLFRVLHRIMPKQDFEAATPMQHLQTVENELINRFGLRRDYEKAMTYGAGPGHEWGFTTPQQRKVFVRAYLIADGERRHVYVLMAEGSPLLQRNDYEVNNFFNAFVLLFGTEGTNAHRGRVIFEETDDLLNGGRRDNEFATIAVHPTKPIALAADLSGRLFLAGKNEQRQFSPTDNKEIEQIVVSPDGRWLALSAGGMIHFWSNWDTNVNLGTRQSVPGRRCAINKENRLLVADQNTVHLFDLATAKWRDSLLTNGMATTGIALAPDDTTLALHDGKTVALWNWATKKRLGVFEAHAAPITTMVFSPDGKTLATGSADRTIKLWDVATRTERATLKQHAWTVSTLAFTPDSKHLASGGLDGMLLLWDVQPDEPTLVWAQAHQFPVRGVAFDAIGQNCYSIARQAAHMPMKEGLRYRRQLRKIAWADMQANPVRAAKIVAQNAGLHLPISNGAIFMSRDGQTIATTSDAMPVDFNRVPPLPHMTRIWDAATARQRHATETLFSSVLSPDGRWLAFSAPGGNAAVQVMEVATQRVSPVLWRSESNIMPIVFFAPDGAFLWVTGPDELIQFALPKAKSGLAGNALPVPERRRLSFKNPGAVPKAITVVQAVDQKSFIVNAGVWDQTLWKRTLYSVEDGKEKPWPKMGPDQHSSFLSIRRQQFDQIELTDAVSGITRVVGRQAGWMSWLPVGNIDAASRWMFTGGALPQRVLKITLWDLKAQQPILAFPDLNARAFNRMYFSPDGRFFACITNAGATRVLPMDWLLERKDLLPCDPNEVAGP